MANILLQTTIPDIADDWNVGRFALLADELRRAGHVVSARNRDADGDDSVLSVLDSLEYDQLWLMAVDTGDGLTPGDAAGIMRFRERGGGVLTARDHEDLGACLCCLGSIGQLNHFHSTNPATDAAPRRPGQPEHLVAQLSLRPERRLPARARGRTAARTPANVEEQQRTHRMLPRTSSRRCRVCAGRVLVRTSDRARPQHGDRPNVQLGGRTRRRTDRRRPAAGPRGGVVDVPPFRRYELGRRLRCTIVRHRAAQRRDQPRPVGASRRSRTTYATSRAGWYDLPGRGCDSRSTRSGPTGNHPAFVSGSVTSRSSKETQARVPRSYRLTVSALPGTATVTVPFTLSSSTATWSKTPAAGGDDGGPQSETLTFTGSTVLKTIAIPIYGDLVPEPDETITIALGTVTGATGNRSTGTSPSKTTTGANTVPGRRSMRHLTGRNANPCVDLAKRCRNDNASGGYGTVFQPRQRGASEPHLPGHGRDRPSHRPSHRYPRNRPD